MMLLRIVAASALLSAGVAAQEAEFNTQASAGSFPGEYYEGFGYTKDLALSVTNPAGFGSGFAQAGEGYLKASAISTWADSYRASSGRAQFVGYFQPSQTADVTFNMWLNASVGSVGRDGGILESLEASRHIWGPSQGHSASIFDFSTLFRFDIQVIEWGSSVTQSASFSAIAGSYVNYEAFPETGEFSILFNTNTSIGANYTNDLGQLTSDFANVDSTEQTIDRNFSSRFSLVGRQQYTLVLEMACEVTNFASPTVIAASGFDPAQLGSSCDAANSAYWNGTTDIRGPQGQALPDFGLGIAGVEGNYVYSSPLSPQPQRPGPFFAQSAVPEPATWATMILGFGAVGGTARLTAKRRSALPG